MKQEVAPLLPEEGLPSQAEPRPLAGLADLQRRLTRISGDVLEAVAREAVAMTSASGAIIELSDGPDVHVRSGAGSLAPLEGLFSRPGRTFFGFPHDHDQMVCVPEAESGAADWPTCRAHGVHSLLLIPLVHQGNTLGFLNLVSERSRAFSSHDCDVAHLLGGMATNEIAWQTELERREHAVAEKTGELITAVQREHRFVRLLQEIAVAANQASSDDEIEEAVRAAIESIYRFTGWQVGHLLLVRRGSEKLASTPTWFMTNPVKFNSLRRVTEGADLRRGVGLPGRVLATGRPLWVRDIREETSVRSNLAANLGVRASLAFPLFIRTEVVGVLEFFSDSTAEPGERLLEVMGNIGTQLGRLLERRRAAHAQADSENRYKQLFEQSLAGVFRTSGYGRIVECNRAFAELFGHDSPASMKGSHLRELFVDPQVPSTFIDRLQTAFEVRHFEGEVRRADGSQGWVLINATYIAEEERTYGLGTLLDITERKQIEQEVTHQATHDPLTGLSNRAHLMAELEKLLALSRRTGSTAALLYIDLDEFKPINDTWGHAAGDAVLQETAARLRSSVRGSDLIARIGGDEFIVVLSTLTHASDAATVAEKILAALRQPFRHGEHDLTVTASIGGAIFPEDANDAVSLLREADDSMYQAKRAGRNAIVLGA